MAGQTGSTAATSDNVYKGGISFNSSIGGTGSGTLIFDLPLSTVASFQDRSLSFLQGNSANNQAFLTKTIAGAQGGVNAARGAAFGYMNRGLSGIHSGNALLGEQIMAMNFTGHEFSITRAGNAPRAQTSGMCFITTAVCELENKPDDCPELTILRAFRDEVMMNHSEWSLLVREYYRIAPSIVRRIQAMPDEGREFFMRLNVQYLKPAIRAVLNKDYSEAVRIYSRMVRVADKLTRG